MSARAVSLALGVIAFSLGACAKHDEAPVAPTATVEVAAARVQSVDAVLATFGSVEYATAHTLAVVIQVDAEVREVMVLPGAMVRRGQPLLRLGPSAASALEVAKAGQDNAAAQSDAGRVRRLREQSLATAAEEAAANATAANAERLSASLRTRIGDGHGIVVTAPTDGVVDAISVHPGELVAAGAVVASLGDPSRLQVRLGIETADLANVRPGQAVAMTAVAGQRGAAGRIGVVDRHVDHDTHLASALIALPPDAALNVGESVRGRIVIATHPHAVTVPRSALLYDKDEAYVFTARGDQAKRVPVRPGIDTGDAVEIDEGIAPGTNVVVRGNYELEDGMAIHVVAGTPSQ